MPLLVHHYHYHHCYCHHCISFFSLWVRCWPDSFATLEEVFDIVPLSTGFNIEIKYPTIEQLAKRKVALYPERNQIVDAVLKVPLSRSRAGWPSAHPSLTTHIHTRWCSTMPSAIARLSTSVPLMLTCAPCSVSSVLACSLALSRTTVAASRPAAQLCLVGGAVWVRACVLRV
jgi:hypothetical protein